MSKFVTVDLAKLFNATRQNKATGKAGAKPWPQAVEASLAGLPADRQVFWGIPFRLGKPGARGRCLILLPRGRRDAVEIPVRKTARYLCVGHVDEVTGNDIARRVGEHLADYVVHYADGSQHVVPIRHRIEINGMAWPWAAGAMAAVAAQMPSGVGRRPG